jgi:hypothetical protein
VVLASLCEEMPGMSGCKSYKVRSSDSDSCPAC